MASGVKINDLVQGTGPVAERGTVVVIHLRTYLNRGELLQDTSTEDSPLRIDLGKRETIAGLRKGIEGMRTGGRRELVVSPHLAYGEKGAGKVPPNAVLRFEVELLEVMNGNKPGGFKKPN